MTNKHIELSELLPCPFCGNAKNIAMANEKHDHSGGYFIACPACDASTGLRYAMGEDPRPLLVEQWNRRAAIAAHEQARVVGEPVAWFDPAQNVAFGSPLVWNAKEVERRGETLPHPARSFWTGVHPVPDAWMPFFASPPAPQEAQAGMVLVPREPTPKMLAALWEHRDSMRGYGENSIARVSYNAMLAAAPVAQPATTEQAEAPRFNLDPTPISGWGQQPIGMGTLGTFEHRCPAVTGHRGGVFVCQSAGHGVSQNSYCKGCTCPAALATQPTASNAGERERFEALASDQGFDLRRLETNEEDYLDLRTQGPWEFWQARAALASKPPAGEQKPKFQAIYFRRNTGIDRLVVPAAEDPGSHVDRILITKIELLYTAPQPEQLAQDREALVDLIAQHLSGTYHCTRVWEAWRVGTMNQDDFEDVGESDTPADLADAILAQLSKGAAK